MDNVYNGFSVVLENKTKKSSKYLLYYRNK